MENLGGAYRSKHGAIINYASGSKAASFKGDTADSGGLAVETLGHDSGGPPAGLEGISGTVIETISCTSKVFELT